jgi:predicted nucleic acid-binding protein
MIAADSNLVAYLLIPGDKSALADAVLEKDPDWATPLICRSELRNILTLYMRHEGMTLAQAQQTMTRAERLLAPNEYSVPSDPILALAKRTGISAYDAEFVVLAKQLDLMLVTLDKGVLKASPEVAVHPVSFLST